MVSTAGPVKEAWARCVREVKDPFLGLAGGKGCKKQCDALFAFVVTKWHNCRFFAFTKELTSLKKRLKKRKAEMALRDQLKAGVGGSFGRRETTAAERKTKSKEPTVYTAEQRARQLQLKKNIGPTAWKSLTCEHLIEYVRECGGNAAAIRLRICARRVFSRCCARSHHTRGCLNTLAWMLSNQRFSHRRTGEDDLEVAGVQVACDSFAVVCCRWRGGVQIERSLRATSALI